MKTELKPCPFCGAGETIIHANKGAWNGHGFGEPVSVEVRHWCAELEGQPARMIARVGRDEASAIAAWNCRADEAAAVVYPPDSTASPFTVINLGFGMVQMGDCIHDRRLPALWFGKDGKGMGHGEVLNREAKEGETIAVVTFANVDGLDVLLDVVQRIRRDSFPGAAPAPADQVEDARDAARYRWLREQHWNESTLFVVAGHHSLVRLGTDCPSDERLDTAIDAAMSTSKEAR